MVCLGSGCSLNHGQRRKITESHRHFRPFSSACVVVAAAAVIEICLIFPSFFPSLSSPPPHHPPSPCLSATSHQYLAPSLCFSTPLSPPFCLYLSVSSLSASFNTTSPPLSVCPSVSVSPSLSICLSLCLCLSLSFCLSLFLRLSASLSFLLVCLSLFLSVSL